MFSNENVSVWTEPQEYHLVNETRVCFPSYYLLYGSTDASILFKKKPTYINHSVLV